jgi:hypothetical protein
LKKLLFFLLCSLPLFATDEFIVITPQKTGTNLITKALYLLLDKEVIRYPWMWISNEELTALLDLAKREKKFVHIHAFCQPQIVELLKQRKCKVIFLMRDPRDQAVSLHFYCLNHGFYYGPINPNGAFGTLSFQDQLDEIITGRRFGLSIPKEIIGKRLEWMDGALTVRFENLVGTKGGGTESAQIQELDRLLKFISHPLSSKKIKKRTQDLFGKPGDATFRTGQIGEWKKYFNEENKISFKQVFGEELIQLGYEKNYDW